MLKQIKIKGGVKLITSCNACPCKNRDVHGDRDDSCNLDADNPVGGVSFANDCPLDDYNPLLGTETTCPKCGHVWNYKGTAVWITCPSCRKLIKNPEVQKCHKQ